MNRKPDFMEILREGLVLTGAVAIIAAAVFFGTLIALAFKPRAK